MKIPVRYPELQGNFSPTHATKVRKAFGVYPHIFLSAALEFDCHKPLSFLRYKTAQSGKRVLICHKILLPR